MHDSPRWRLWGTTTNAKGNVFFTLSPHGADDSGYGELEQLLKKRFAAEASGELVGPYSIHKYFNVRGLTLGIILDEPDFLNLYAKNEDDMPAVASLVVEILNELNAPSA